jgi:hypothetical protein
MGQKQVPKRKFKADQLVFARYNGAWGREPMYIKHFCFDSYKGAWLYTCKHLGNGMGLFTEKDLVKFTEARQKKLNELNRRESYYDRLDNSLFRRPNE